MEDLTKHQLILINLLVTFVTSIATGVITFTLLSEAPVEVTQQINRVVEKTIERVVTEPGEPERVVETVVVNEEDRVIEAISKNEKSVVRLKTLGADGTEIVSGLGIIVSTDGIVVADLRSYSSTVSHSISFHDGKVFPTGKVFVDNTNSLVFIKTTPPKNEPKYVFYPVTFGNSDGLKIGQTMVAISGKDSNAISIGRARQLLLSDDKKTVTNILSDISVSRPFPGSPIVNLSGEVVGLEKQAVELDTTYSYLPINIVKISLLKALEEFAE